MYMKIAYSILFLINNFMYSYFKTQTFWKTVLVYVSSYLIFGVLVSIPMYFVPGFEENMTNNPKGFLSYLTAILFMPNALICLWYIVQAKYLGTSVVSDFQKIRSTGFRWTDGAMLVFFNLVLSLASAFVLVFLLQKFALDSGIDMNPLAAEKATQTLWFVLVGTIITAIIWPIAEEFVFRGAIFTGLLGKLGFYPSMLISSFLFMIIHSPVQYLWAFVFGVMMVYVYYKTKNIAIVIILHIINNLVPSFLSIYDAIFPWNSWTQQELSFETGAFIEWLQIIIPFVIIGCVFLFILIKKRWFLKYQQDFNVS